MTYRMSNTCMDVLARAYYGLDLIGGAERYKKQARRCSIKWCRRLQWVTEDNKITDTGIWELNRAVKKERERKTRTRK